MTMNIRIRIDELVFYGFDYNDGKKMRIAFEKELTRLIADGSFPTSIAINSKTSNLDVESLTINTDANPRNIGTETAKSIHQVWSRSLQNSPR